MSGDAIAKAGASTADQNTSGDALTLLTQGKRHLLVKDFTEAVSSLGQACELLAAKYGESADECGEAYLFYGKALLELARSEGGVLGDAIENEDSSEESDENVEAEKNGKENAEEGEKDEMDISGEKMDTSEDKGVDTGEKVAEDGGGDDDSASKEEESRDVDGDGEEDVSNLKLAWEMLELAKIIFQRQAKDVQMNLKLAEVYLNLGEVGLESETYDQAIQDLQCGLKIQKEHLESDDRRIAETYHQLGVAYGLNSEFSDAVEQYTNALELLELRIKNLQVKQASGEKLNESDAFYTIEGEIEELNAIIPDVRDKIAEMKETKAEAYKAFRDMIKEGCPGTSKVDTATKCEGTKAASSIAHLVRKKQKIEEISSVQKSPSPDAVPAKIQKGE